MMGFFGHHISSRNKVKVTVRTIYRSLGTVDDASSAGRFDRHHRETSISRPPVIVIGERKQAGAAPSPAGTDRLAMKERFGERSREADDLDGRQEATIATFQNGGLRKVFAPENLPARDGPPVGAEEPREFADSARRGPLPHGG